MLQILRQICSFDIFVGFETFKEILILIESIYLP